MFGPQHIPVLGAKHVSNPEYKRFKSHYMYAGSGFQDAALAEAAAQRAAEEQGRIAKEAENEKLRQELETMRKRLELQEISRRRSLEREELKHAEDDAATHHAAMQKERELQLEKERAALRANKEQFDREDAVR